MTDRNNFQHIVSRSQLAKMVKTTSHFTNKRGQKLYWVAHVPDSGEVKAVLCWHHGLGGETRRTSYVNPLLTDYDAKVMIALVLDLEAP